MLSMDKIASNKKRFISLLKQIKRPDCLIDELITKLENSDFFRAPASTQYHCAFEGGLCQHSLNVYDQLKKLVNMEYPKFIASEDGEMKEVDNYVCPISDDSIIITALLHDLSKMNFYETTTRNVKDEKGNWVQVPFIKVREAKDRFLYSTHGTNSEYMVGRFIPLTLEESVAIINHMGGMDSGAVSFDGGLSQIYNRYQLALLLHCADMLATFHDEAM